MNSLTTLTDAQLDKAIEDLKERELALHTESGRKYLVSKMRELIMHLQELGYVIHADENGLAQVWANSFADEFVRLGADGMRAAVDQWVAEDSSEYRMFPKIPWIKEACRKIGGDPRIEKGKRVQEEAERRMEEEHKKEMEQLKREHPRLWEMVEQKAAEMERRTHEKPTV